MLISLSITRIAECVCARVALDSAKRNFELPLIPDGSRNVLLRNLIVETAAEVIKALGRKAAGTNVGRIKPQTDDMIVLEYKATHCKGMVVNARINLETAIVGRVLSQLYAENGREVTRWYAALVRAATSSYRLLG